jgi:hypothetical protein
MFIEVVGVESRNHPYGDPDIEVAKIALRTFIKHHHDEVQATIPVGEHEFIIRRVDELTKYEYETFSYKTFKASAWSVPPVGVGSECTTTYEFRTFVDEQAFVVSTSPSSHGLETIHGDAMHSHDYWQSVEGGKVISELISLLKQEDVIPQLIALVNESQPDGSAVSAEQIKTILEHADLWVFNSKMEWM